MIITNGKMYAMSVGNSRKNGVSITWTNNASYARVYDEKTATRLASMAKNKGQSVFTVDESGLAGFRFAITTRDLKAKKAGVTENTSARGVYARANLGRPTVKNGVVTIVNGNVKTTIRRIA